MTVAEAFTALNPAQREAVEHGGGPLLVLAGAGSGKTRVLTSRIARIIERELARPDQILAVTFTNKAAKEMKGRVARALGYDPRGMWIGTFHAIGARIVRANADLVGRTPGYTIYDQDDTLAVVRRLMARHHIPHKQWAPRLISATISEARNALVTPQEFASLALTPLAKAVTPVYHDWDGEFVASNAVCFDDLLWLPVMLLRQNGHVAVLYIFTGGIASLPSAGLFDGEVGSTPGAETAGEHLRVGEAELFQGGGDGVLPH